MNIIDIPWFLDRIDTGATTVDDAAALRAFLRRDHRLSAALNLDPDPGEPPADGRNFADSWTARIDSDAVVAVTYDPTRYARGELVIKTVYKLADGSVDTDRPRRVNIDEQIAYFLRDLWEILFEAACIAKDSDPNSLLIHLDLPESGQGLPKHPPGLPHYIRAVAEIAAAELQTYVSGVAPNPSDWTY
jgi:hypothetical protein